MARLTWQALLAAAEHDPAIRTSTDLYAVRVPEEFYDLSADPCERVNLIASPAHQAEIKSLREELLAMMRRTGDPFAEAFGSRGDPELVPATIKKLLQESATRRDLAR